MGDKNHPLIIPFIELFKIILLYIEVSSIFYKKKTSLKLLTMKSKLFLLSFLMLLTIATNYAQSSASQSGIAVQGIARDSNNTAIADQEITFTCTIYYDTDKNIYSKDIKAVTDNFGVFSIVLEVDPSKNGEFFNNLVYLKIEDKTNSTLISDELFKHVPYAISANNGVPTGSIMPYIGGNAPEGWVLCNGQNLNAIDGSANLRALLNSNIAPNLQGRFLKGVGTSVEANVEPISLNTPQSQSQSLKSHTHNKGSLVANDNKAIPNNRNVPISTTWAGRQIRDGETTGNIAPFPYYGATVLENNDTNHQHTISGITGSTGNSNEVRPSSYGVNYIIKL
jgi:hypothetical protein